MSCLTVNIKDTWPCTFHYWHSKFFYCYALSICYASFQQYQSTIYINPSIHKSTTRCQQCGGWWLHSWCCSTFMSYGENYS